MCREGGEAEGDGAEGDREENAERGGGVLTVLPNEGSALVELRLDVEEAETRSQYFLFLLSLCGAAGAY